MDTFDLIFRSFALLYDQNNHRDFVQRLGKHGFTRFL